MFPCPTRPNDQIFSDMPDDESFANFLPLTRVVVRTEIADGLANIQMTQEYLNPSSKGISKNKNNPNKRFNLVYKFPQEKDTILNKIVISVDGRTIESAVECQGQKAGIEDKKVAFDQNASVVSDAREKTDLVQLFVGDVKSGSKITVKLSLIRAIPVDFGAFNFVLPLSYFPKFRKQNMGELEKEYEPNIELNFKCRVRSENNITQVCCPRGFITLEEAPNDISVVTPVQTDLQFLTKDI